MTAVPLIDDRAARLLRRIESAAAAILSSKICRALSANTRSPKNKPALVRSAFGQLNECARFSLPPPPSLIKLLAVLTDHKPMAGQTAGDRRPLVIDYLASLPEGKRATANGISVATGISRGTAQTLLSDEWFWETEVRPARWAKEHGDDAEHEMTARLDENSLSGDFVRTFHIPHEWIDARRAIVDDALAGGVAKVS